MAILSKRLIVSNVRHFAQFGLVQVGDGNFDVSAIVHFNSLLDISAMNVNLKIKIKGKL